MEAARGPEVRSKLSLILEECFENITNPDTFYLQRQESMRFICDLLADVAIATACEVCSGHHPKGSPADGATVRLRQTTGELWTLHHIASVSIMKATGEVVSINMPVAHAPGCTCERKPDHDSGDEHANG